MIKDLPTWVNALFLLSFFLCLVFFFFANNRPLRLSLLLLLWCGIHSILAHKGFYLNTEANPPRFALVLIPSMLLVVIGLLPRSRKWFLKNRNIQFSTSLHSVRIGVELVLYGLFLHKMVPELMTFSGRNFDILAGLSALIILILINLKRINWQALIIWNLMGLALVCFILVNGILSAELPFQQFAFDQPNRGIAYFPFILLPAFIVPVVIWTHLSDLVVLFHKKEDALKG